LFDTQVKVKIAVADTLLYGNYFFTRTMKNKMCFYFLCTESFFFTENVPYALKLTYIVTRTQALFSFYFVLANQF
jgi:hypothetical protein